MGDDSPETMATSPRKVWIQAWIDAELLGADHGRPLITTWAFMAYQPQLPSTSRILGVSICMHHAWAGISGCGSRRLNVPFGKQT
jgi:hypothetical protein